MSRFGIFKNGVRYRTKSGSRFTTAAKAWEEVRNALGMPDFVAVDTIKAEHRIEVKRLADRLWYVGVDNTCTLIRARDEANLLKAIEEQKGNWPEHDDRFIVVRTPAGRWTAIVVLDKSTGGYVGRYDFFKV